MKGEWFLKYVFQIFVVIIYNLVITLFLNELNSFKNIVIISTL